MRWRTKPVETVRPSRFRPPFCPWPDCPAHRHRGRRHRRLIRYGSYTRAVDRRRIPRFRCRDCGRTCSQQTFSCTYFLKRPDLLPAVAAGLQAGSAHRQLGRSLHCAKTSVTRLARRLARHAVLLQARLEAELPPWTEAVVHDHFETFVGCQKQALALGTAVGTRSRFVFGPDPAPHRGSGRRPDRPDGSVSPWAESDAYVHSIQRSLDRLLRLVPEGEQLVLVADGRSDYRTAQKNHPAAERIQLVAHPNPIRGPKGSPRSKEAIARDLAMAPVDQLHQLLRHTCAEHKRETIAFGRAQAAVWGRAFLTTVWKNLVKGRSERRPDRSTPAMALGLTGEPWRWERVLAQRLFPQREALPDSWRPLLGPQPQSQDRPDDPAAPRTPPHSTNRLAATVGPGRLRVASAAPGPAPRGPARPGPPRPLRGRSRSPP
jgi:transposase-like protein